MASRTVEEMLKDRFAAAKSVDALVKHFQSAVAEFHKGEWEKSLAKCGKFLEAVLKALLQEAGLPPQVGRQFKVENAINALAQVPNGTADDAIRLSIPRCCRFVYDVTSNRGGRHDPDEIDPNEMDSTAVLSACAWVLGEMVRYSQKNADPAEAKTMVDTLVRRRYPFIDEIDGRAYIDLKSAGSARDLGLLILFNSGRKRMAREELIEAIVRQRRSITRANAVMAVTRLLDQVDDDGAGNLRLRASGFREAEALIDSTGQI